MAGYFDLDDILSQETLLPVQFVYGSTAPQRSIGPLVQSGNGQMLAGTNMEVPLWLAKVLHDKRLVRVKRPHFLGEKLQRRLSAGAACENLRARCPYFYTAAKQYTSLSGREEVDVAANVFSAFRERFHVLAGAALGQDRTDGVKDFQMGMSQEELFLFEGTVATSQMIEGWKFDHLSSSS